VIYDRPGAHGAPPTAELQYQKSLRHDVKGTRLVASDEVAAAV